MSQSLNHISIRRVLRIMAVMALLILLIGIVTPSFCIQPVKAQGVSYTVASTGAVPYSTAFNNQRKLAITSDGNIHAVYHRMDSNGIFQIYHAKSSDEGKTWIEEPVTSGSYSQEYPSIAVDSQNNLHIVWRGYSPESPGIAQIRYRKWTPSGWGGILPLTYDTGWHQEYPAIAVDSHDYLHVVWRKTEFNAYPWCSGPKPEGCGPIYYIKYTGSWSAPILIGVSDQNNEINPSISTDRNDYINVVWNEGGYGNAEDWHSASTFFTTSWQQPPYSFERYAGWPSTASDSIGNLHYGSTAAPNYPSIIILHRTRSGSVWGSPETVYSSSTGLIAPSIALDKSDYLHVVWPEDGNIKYRNYTTSWQDTKTIISDTTSSWPNLLWAWNPEVGGKRPNILQNGYAFLYTSGQEIKFYSDTGGTIPQPKPTVTEITPNSGVNNGIIHVTITGSGFMEGATVRLTKIGTLGKIGLYPIVDSPNTIRCSFGLDAATLGSYDVVVTNPDGQIGTLVNGFIVMPENSWTFPLNNMNNWEKKEYYGFWWPYDEGYYHLGIDYPANNKDPVYAIAKGTVLYCGQHSKYGPSSTLGGICIVTHETSDGSIFNAQYAHLMDVCVVNEQKICVAVEPFGNIGQIGNTGQTVEPGQLIGHIINYNPDHLHFGIYDNPSFPDDSDNQIKIKGRILKDLYNSDSQLRNDLQYFKDPSEFLTTHFPKQNPITFNGFTTIITCPVDISITDPDGLKINKLINEILGATYTEFGIGSDGTPDAKIEITERKIGSYLITLTPKSGASLDAPFTLKVQSDGNTQTIANNVQIKDIPLKPYEIQVAENGEITVPVKIRIVPNTLNTASKGKFVAFITLPSNYKAVDVDAKSVVCEGASANRLIRIKAFPNTFAAIFNREKLVNVKPGEKVQLTVTGTINKNGEKIGFSGSDTVKVISKKGTTKEAIDDVEKVTDEKVFSQFNPR